MVCLNYMCYVYGVLFSSNIVQKFGVRKKYLMVTKAEFILSVDIINVFYVTFEIFNASLVHISVNFFQKLTSNSQMFGYAILFE